MTRKWLQSADVEIDEGTGALLVKIDGGGSGSGIQSVVAGTNISVDISDPANPVVACTVEPGGQVNSVVAGTNISVDTSDPANPVVACTVQPGIASVSEDTSPSLGGDLNVGSSKIKSSNSAVSFDDPIVLPTVTSEPTPRTQLVVSSDDVIVLLTSYHGVGPYPAIPGTVYTLFSGITDDGAGHLKKDGSTIGSVVYKSGDGVVEITLNDHESSGEMFFYARDYSSLTFLLTYANPIEDSLALTVDNWTGSVTSSDGTLSGTIVNGYSLHASGTFNPSTRQIAIEFRDGDDNLKSPRYGDFRAAYDTEATLPPVGSIFLETSDQTVRQVTGTEESKFVKTLAYAQ